MKKLLIVLALLTAMTSFAGEIKLSRYDSDDIVLKFQGEEAREVFNRISKSEEFQGSMSGGFLSSTTYIKYGKDITCTREKYSSGEEEFSCMMIVDHKGRIDGASY